jgi:hypothetical protein
LLARLGLLPLGWLLGLLTLLAFRTFHSRPFDFPRARLGLRSLNSAFWLTDRASVFAILLRPA